jgi:hypothetical protein
MLLSAEGFRAFTAQHYLLIGIFIGPTPSQSGCRTWPRNVLTCLSAQAVRGAGAVAARVGRSRDYRPSPGRDRSSACARERQDRLAQSDSTSTLAT